MKTAKQTENLSRLSTPRLIRCLSALLALLLLGSAPSALLPAAGASEVVPAEDALPFSDVAPEDWFYSDVLSAWSKGLVNGKSPSVYAPFEGILLSEAVKLAACMHQRYAEGTVTLSNGEDVWYSTYAAYAMEQGILTAEPADWDAPALRGEIMELFARAVPLEFINDVPDGSIADVPMDHPCAEAIYALYRAGIVQGNDDSARLCHPDAWVIRAEIAATLTRMTDPDARIRFSMGEGTGDHPEDAEDPGYVPEDPGYGEHPEESRESGEDDFPADPNPLDGERAWSELTLAWAAAYDGRFGEGASDGILLTDAEIDAYNAAMTASCPTMTDLLSRPDQIPGAEAAALIGQYALPVGYDFDREGNFIGEYKRAAVLANRNLEALGEVVTAERAVVTDRCDMKSFPMEDGFYPWGEPGFNQIQETELTVGTPVIILHRSADGEWYFAQTYHYSGWIPVRSAAVCGTDTFDRFVRRDPSAGVTVTAPFVTAGGVRLDMGVWLPLLGEGDGGYDVLIPVRGYDGEYAETAAHLSYDDAVAGRLPYTMKNVYEQAFRWLGTPYGWGGADGGVDCSGFICAVMRSFGILIPRNTREQRVWSGAVTDISGMDAGTRAELFASSRFPAAIHRQGHVMLYLGESDGQVWIIHAHSIGQPVSIAALDPRSAMLAMVELRP